MQPSDAERILEKIHSGSASERERELFYDWYEGLDRSEGKVFLSSELNRCRAEMAGKLIIKSTKPVHLWRRMAVAASLLLILAIGILYQGTRRVEDADNADVVPGGNKAFLTLGNGKRIAVDNRADGELAMEQGVRIYKNTDGELVYEVLNDASAPGVLNSFQTPRGGTFAVTLPDGTKVWLNSASKITYLSNFASLKERKITLVGEAYFEVAKRKIPFRVKSGDQELEVLGTHFNVNAYQEDAEIKTTLLEGSLRLNTAGLPGPVLNPGERAVLVNKGFKVSLADEEVELAWKNGKMVFNHEDLGSIMKRVSRWYDIDVVYEDGVENVRFGGALSRDKKISSILNYFKETENVDYKIRDRKVTLYRKNKQ